jgi:hypothetical protein
VAGFVNAVIPKELLVSQEGLCSVGLELILR